MNGDDGLRLNRRRLLTAISTVGAAGALTGRGAAAYLLDREAFAGNHVAAGSVTLALDGLDAQRVDLSFTIDDYGFGNRDAETVCLGLGEASNSAWVWIRACPVDPVEDALDARLAADGETVYTGSLGGLLAFLSGSNGGGVLLTALADGDDPAPVTPGTDEGVCLTVEVWAPTTLADDPDTVRALKRASPLAITVDVYAEQARHVPTPRRPVAGENPSFTFPVCEPTGGDEGEGEGDGNAISNISLCTATPVDPAGITWTVRDPGTNADVTGSVAEPFAVRVTSPVPIQYAVVKAGQRFGRFDAGGATTVTVTATGGTTLDVPGNFARCACAGDGVKLDWNDATDAFDAPEVLSCGGESDEEDEDESDGPGKGGGPTGGGPPGGGPPGGGPSGPNSATSAGDEPNGGAVAPGTSGGTSPGDDT